MMLDLTKIQSYDEWTSIRNLKSAPVDIIKSRCIDTQSISLGGDEIMRWN